MAALPRTYSKFLMSFSTSTVARMSGEGHGGGGWAFWKKAFFFGAIPVMVLGHINAFVLAEHEERPEFKPYDHMYIRSKKFPWGDGNKSLFHNPHVNALPYTGYEDEQ